MNFIDKLTAAWTANHSLLCVGLDPDLAKLPAELRDAPDGITTFCARIIDATADLACAFKPQIAYFGALGAEKQLEDICRYLRENYPHIPLILDASAATSAPPPPNMRAKRSNAMAPTPSPSTPTWARTRSIRIWRGRTAA